MGDGRTKLQEYRDALETWAEWWDGPGRQHYRHFVKPPISATQEALRCIGCAGPDEPPPGERCKMCGSTGDLRAVHTEQGGDDGE